MIPPKDVWFLEKLAHFDREVIPERRMHAKGSGAFGKFTVTNDITAYTKPLYFLLLVRKRKCLSVFSTVAGERGAADAERDIRGFAIKFYTEEGNWDLVGNNTPVFFLRDPLKFPDLNHAVKRDPRPNMRSPLNNWDFWTSLPEALHQVTITMSDRGIPASYRHMHGYGSHTFSLINARGERVWVKFHLHIQQGIKNLTDQEAEAIIAKDRESHQRDLYESIERGDFPRWTMYIRLMTEEQAAFNPANVVPGISFSPDRMLQGRLFSYGDTQRYRLGVNHHQIPVNRSRCPFLDMYHRDGQMRVDGNHGSTLGYESNSFGEWQQQSEYKEPPLELDGAAYQWDYREYFFELCTEYHKTCSRDSPSDRPGRPPSGNSHRKGGCVPRVGVPQ